MSDIEARDQVRILRTSRDPVERLRAATSLGRLADAGRWQEEVLTLAGSDVQEVAMSLAEALHDRSSPLIRAEAAWALGRVGGITAMRRLLARMTDVFPSGETTLLGPENAIQEESANVTATLIAALGRSLSGQASPHLKDDTDELRQAREVLLRQLNSEASADVRVAIVETLVALSVRAQEAGLDLPTDLSPVLCGENTEAILAAIAVLRETSPDAYDLAVQWHSRSDPSEPNQAVTTLVDNWGQRLRELGGCQPEQARLLEWLDIAAVVWGLRETAQPTS